MADYQQVTEIQISAHSKPAAKNFQITQGNSGCNFQNESKKAISV